VVTDDVEDTVAALLPPKPPNAKKPPTPSPTTTTQITATIVILRAWWARRERRCCWRSMRSRASLRCRSFLPVTDPFPPGCLLPAYQRNFANGTGTREVVTSLLSVRGWAEWIGSL
jgi:hypothetical protein